MLLKDICSLLSFKKIKKIAFWERFIFKDVILKEFFCGIWPKRNLTLNKRWNWSHCTKLALKTRWSHGLTANLLRASEQNLVVTGSNSTQANLLSFKPRQLLDYETEDFTPREPRPKLKPCNSDFYSLPLFYFLHMV